MTWSKLSTVEQGMFSVTDAIRVDGKFNYTVTTYFTGGCLGRRVVAIAHDYSQCCNTEHASFVKSVCSKCESPACDSGTYFYDSDATKSFEDTRWGSWQIDNSNSYEQIINGTLVHNSLTEYIELDSKDGLGKWRNLWLEGMDEMEFALAMEQTEQQEIAKQKSAKRKRKIQWFWRK